MLTLQANLKSILDSDLGGYLRITLCGFGIIPPRVAGVGMIADAGIPQIVGPQVGADPIEQALYGNDVIHPEGTFYEVTILDQNKNAIQSGNYIFTGSGTIPICTIDPIVPPYGAPLSSLVYVPCASTVDPTIWTPPSSPKIPIAVAYNGVLMPEGASLPTLSYTNTPAGRITLNFTPLTGERIDALCAI
jgi:hypothetical protein